jgi:hypothetical protein
MRLQAVKRFHNKQSGGRILALFHRFFTERWKLEAEEALGPIIQEQGMYAPLLIKQEDKGMLSKFTPITNGSEVDPGNGFSRSLHGWSILRNTRNI